MSAGIIGFIIGGAICGVVGFLMASCLATENKHDSQKVYQAGYNEGYEDGLYLRDRQYVDIDKD